MPKAGSLRQRVPYPEALEPRHPFFLIFQPSELTLPCEFHMRRFAFKRNIRNERNIRSISDTKTVMPSANRLRTNHESCSPALTGKGLIRLRCPRPIWRSSIPTSGGRRSMGWGGRKSAGPLLVIAGAGSGKTATLAHRVAHLIFNGADPRRILLLTFSRRAAAEMTRRVERIVGLAAKEKAAAALAWSGTFHAIGARLSARACRRGRARPGLHHPRPHRLGRPHEPRPPRARAVEDREALPHQGHVPCDLFAHGQ